MLHIDGSQGEGGGQILRTALTMAMVTGIDIKIDKIRAGRKKPGLMRQHLACVKAAQTVSEAWVGAAKVGSTEITFKPRTIKAGDYHFAVGTAGSTLLIFQTVLPALALAEGRSRLSFEGGTHNFFAPSYDFIRLAYLPLLRKMGVEVDTKLIRHGFYPQGGGQWQAVIEPTGNIGDLNLLNRGELQSKEAVISSANIPGHVAIRELGEISRHCKWSEDTLRAERVECMGSGNIVSMRLHHEHCSEVIESVGRIGVSAERVARMAIRDMRRYQTTSAPVGEHLADQLMLPLAIGKGGVFRTLNPSLHAQTNRDVIHLFTPKRFRFRQLARDYWEISI